MDSGLSWLFGLLKKTTQSIDTLPPFSPIEGHKWFFQISSQRESQKSRFALISFGKNPVFTSLPLLLDHGKILGDINSYTANQWEKYIENNSWT